MSMSWVQILRAVGWSGPDVRSTTWARSADCGPREDTDAGGCEKNGERGDHDQA
jgi:hypothetical protein